jgi:2-polyprenyl-3-methyl-5-hydroxy-6-metoxy-1,4-benzoquinol methylase
MTPAIVQIEGNIEARARQTRGTSADAIYVMVREALQQRNVSRGILLDVGCGTGQLWTYVDSFFERYVGIDAVRYEGFPVEGEFRKANLDSSQIDLPDECADVVAAIETIEHLENPRALMRELTRLVKPGGVVVVTTPNQLSLLSLLSLIIKKQFVSFQDVHYPAHITALLEVDLKRMAAESGLEEVGFQFSRQGRIVLTPWHYPKRLSRLFPRALSDNLLLIATRP